MSCAASANVRLVHAATKQSATSLLAGGARQRPRGVREAAAPGCARGSGQGVCARREQDGRGRAVRTLQRTRARARARAYRMVMARVSMKGAYSAAGSWARPLATLLYEPSMSHCSTWTGYRMRGCVNATGGKSSSSVWNSAMRFRDSSRIRFRPRTSHCRSDGCSRPLRGATRTPGRSRCAGRQRRARLQRAGRRAWHGACVRKVKIVCLELAVVPLKLGNVVVPQAPQRPELQRLAWRRPPWPLKPTPASRR